MYVGTQKDIITSMGGVLCISVPWIGDFMPGNVQYACIYMGTLRLNMNRILGLNDFKEVSGYIVC